MKTAEEMRAVSKKWMDEGVFKQIERFAENGKLECTIDATTEIVVTIDGVIKLAEKLRSLGFEVVPNAFPYILHVSWRHK